MSIVVVATHNAKKAAELHRVLAAAGIDAEVKRPGRCLCRPIPEPAETERTFEGNALIKARAAVAATGHSRRGRRLGNRGRSAQRDAGRPFGPLVRAPNATDKAQSRPADRSARPTLRRPIAPPSSSAPWPWSPRTGDRAPGPRCDARTPGARPRGAVTASATTRSSSLTGNDRHQCRAQPRAEKDAISHRGQAVRAIVPLLLETVLEAGSMKQYLDLMRARPRRGGSRRPTAPAPAPDQRLRATRCASTWPRASRC